MENKELNKSLKIEADEKLELWEKNLNTKNVNHKNPISEHESNIFQTWNLKFIANRNILGDVKLSKFWLKFTNKYKNKTRSGNLF